MKASELSKTSVLWECGDRIEAQAWLVSEQVSFRHALGPPMKQMIEIWKWGGQEAGLGAVPSPNPYMWLSSKQKAPAPVLFTVLISYLDSLLFNVKEVRGPGTSTSTRSSWEMQNLRPYSTLWIRICISVSSSGESPEYPNVRRLVPDTFPRKAFCDHPVWSLDHVQPLCYVSLFIVFLALTVIWNNLSEKVVSVIIVLSSIKIEFSSGNRLCVSPSGSYPQHV